MRPVGVDDHGHRHQPRLARQLALVIPAESASQLTALGVSAQLAHYSSALKNLTLLTVALFIAAVGTGPYSLASL